MRIAAATATATAAVPVPSAQVLLSSEGAAFFVTEDPVAKVQVSPRRFIAKPESISVAVGPDEPMKLSNETTVRAPATDMQEEETIERRTGSGTNQPSKRGFEEFVELKKENRMLKLQIARMQSEGNRMQRGVSVGAGVSPSVSTNVGLTSGKTSRW